MILFSYAKTDPEYKPLIRQVPNKTSLTNTKTVPFVLTLGANKASFSNNSTKFLLNKVITEFFLSMRKKPDEEGCVFPHCITINKDIRTFFAHVKSIHQWETTKESFKGFPGCFDGNIADCYVKRVKEYVSYFIVK